MRAAKLNIYDTKSIGDISSPADAFFFYGGIGGFAAFFNAHTGSAVEVRRAFRSGNVTHTASIGVNLVGNFIGHGTSDGAGTTVLFEDIATQGNVTFQNLAAGHLAVGTFAGGIGGASGAVVTLRRIYDTGSISTLTGAAQYGGFIGLCNPLTLSDVHVDGSLHAPLIGSGTCTSFSTDTVANMKKQSTYANWDFSSIWTIQENTGFPTLR